MTMHPACLAGLVVPLYIKIYEKILYLFPARDILYQPSFGWYRHEKSTYSLPPSHRSAGG